MATDDVCADSEALSSSVDALADVDVRAEGTNGVEAAVDDVSTDLEALKASAGSDLEPQVDALQGSLDDLRTAAADIDSEGAAATVAAASAVAADATTLFDSLDAGACG